ncbi:hypothetical protein HanXRQr2_Chr01g0032551 [Helianthus annuus]|uniref:Uncharacterized protein n=1 Tax=Helianthus annuus TaxID=4232 RepID=A0A9K3P333_HELAN|nr:hypothetical protein HanXRQr2_Chr01g0032551 [Helianthus annuus]KAJ0957791.1 hypothetical protein HanPSC8_Chr01g0031741 [Helianthus annuus]
MKALEYGVVDEFGIPKIEDANPVALQPSWRFGNGMFAVVFVVWPSYNCFEES